MRSRRGFTLMELLVVIAIILVIAAILFPVFTQAKRRAKLTDCQTHLHQDALGIQMYRTDNDGQAWLKYQDWSKGRGYTTAGGYRAPWNDWLPAADYIKDGRLVWCSEPNKDPAEITVYDLNHFRYLSPPEPASSTSITVWTPLDTAPGRVVAYCVNHTTMDREQAMPTNASHIELWKGTYPVVREDGSSSMVKSSQIELWYLWRDGTWHKTEDVSGVSSQAWRFPNEPWPPVMTP